jgi:hypothetical protein
MFIDLSHLGAIQFVFARNLKKSTQERPGRDARHNENDLIVLHVSQY